MGALHEGHAALMRAARAARRLGDRHDLREPAAVRAERGLRPLPAHAGRRPGGLPGRRASTWSSRRTATRCTRAASRRSRVNPGPLGEILEGASRPGLLPRRAHRGAQAAPAHPRRPGVLRREGLPAARPDPPDGARPGRSPSRSSACRPCGSPTGWPCPAATATCRLGAARRRCALSAALRAGAAAAGRGAVPTARSPRPHQVVRRRVRPACKLDYLVAAPTRPRPAARPTDRRGCWSRPGSAPPA